MIIVAIWIVLAVFFVGNIYGGYREHVDGLPIPAEPKPPSIGPFR